MCPLSSAALPLRSSARSYRVSRVLLRSIEPMPIDQAVSSLPEPSPSELEVIAGGASRKLVSAPAHPGTPHCADPTVVAATTGRSNTVFADASGAKWRNIVRPCAKLSSQCCRSPRVNLALDSDVFPAAVPLHHSAPVMLSPTEPKRQIINDAQRLKVSRQSKRTVAGTMEQYDVVHLALLCCVVSHTLVQRFTQANPHTKRRRRQRSYVLCLCDLGSSYSQDTAC